MRTVRVHCDQTDTFHDCPVHDAYVGVRRPDGSIMWQPAYVKLPDGGVVRLPNVPASAFDEGRFLFRPTPADKWIAVQWDDPV